jgi:hypothetical protein
MTTAIMEQPLTTLEFSEEFLSACKKMGYGTLQEIISDNPEALVKRKGFSYHWLSELSRYLIKIDALHLLQEIRGSNHA